MLGVVLPLVPPPPQQAHTNGVAGDIVGGFFVGEVCK